MNNEFRKLQNSPREIARWQKAQQQLIGNRFAPALSRYRDMVKRFPGVAQLWFELGIAATGELEFEAADQAFRRTTELAADDVSMLILVAQQYQRLRKLDRVNECFERAVAADPNSPQALLSLSLWHEKAGRLDDAWTCAEACTAKHPQDGQALYVRALLLHRAGDYAEAEALLRDLIKRDLRDLGVKSSVRFLLAEVLDEVGHYAEAMRWLFEAKAIARQMANTPQLEREYDRNDLQRRELLAALTPEVMQHWRQEGPALPYRQQLALLGGHPRSGTTLLEKILGAHPGIHEFDEPEAFLNEIWNTLAPMNAPRALKLDDLNALSVSRIAEMRRRYLKSLFREVEGEPDAQVLLDKNPSPTMALYLWLRIFPELKVIMAIRDPRDVLVSCFFQNLTPTATNANFLSLERAARHYADLMDVWLRVRDLGGFDWIQVRYEDLVANLEGEGRRATEYLGLSWCENQSNFHQTTSRRFVFAPTHSDVTKQVYNRAVGRWKNYAETFAPIQERLAPYCRAFGYDPGGE